MCKLRFFVSFFLAIIHLMNLFSGPLLVKKQTALRVVCCTAFATKAVTVNADDD